MIKHLIASCLKKGNRGPMKTWRTMPEQSTIKSRTSKTILSVKPV